jgi:phage tail sheath gpL-like
MSNSITVPGFPDNNRVPGVFASIDASKANTGTINQRGLIIGQIASTGTIAPNKAVISAGVGDARVAGGVGSALAIATERWRAIDLTGELWYGPLADATGSAAAVGNALWAGTATANGVIPLYLNGSRVSVPVNSGDTAAIVSGNVASAVNNFTTAGGNTLPMVASVDGTTAAKTDFTAINKGSLGNQNTINLSFGGPSQGEGQPGTTNVPGITCTITPFAGGTTDPVLTALLDNLPEIPFDFIFCPFNDTTSLNAIQAFLGDQAGRWNWSVQLFGGAFTAKGGTLSTRTTWSTARNDQHTDAIGANGSPSPDWYWGVDFAAAHAVSIRSNPTISIGGLIAGVALNVVAPPLELRDDFAERQTLLFDGMSTYKVDNSGTVRVDRAITTYQSTGGTPDDSYLSSNVPYQLMAYIRAVETMIGTNFNQVILVSDGTRIPPGSRMVTSQTILFSVIAQYRQIATAGLPGAPVGLVQNPDAFDLAAQAENAGGGIVKLLLPVALGNQLIAVAMNIQFTQP